MFDGLDVHVAGKTGTAQESQKRGNHAFFISFAPYENPEISVTVSIPNGYSSSNAAMVAKHVYRYFYGYASLDDILNSGALDASNERINGDPDVKALLRIAQVYDIPIANNKATADFMITSPLMDEEYEHDIINFHQNIKERAKKL